MQVNSLTGSATGLISNAQHKAATAAQTIATLSEQSGEVGSSQNTATNDIFKPILSLKEAELETSAGVKLLQQQNKAIGSIINIKA
jgi:hypothetical protein